MMHRGLGKLWALPLLLCLLAADGWAQRRVSGYSPVQTTVGYQPSSNLNVTVQLSGFVMPPAPRQAYWGGNQAAGGTPISIVAAETNASTFIVGIPPNLRNTPGQTPIVLCERVNLGGKSVDGACTDPSISALFRVNPAPTINSASPLPAGTVNATYSFNFTASGGTGTKSFNIQSGAIPAGMDFTAAGVLSGTPIKEGTYSFVVRVRDALNVATTKRFSLTITGPLTITTAATLPTGTVKSSYSVNLAASGGLPPYTWSAPGDGLPPGLSINQSTGAITGVPESAGDFQFRIQVRAATGGTVSKTFRLVIVAPLIITTGPQLPRTMVGQNYNQTITASGGSKPYTWQVATGSTLPPGLDLDSSRGTIAGQLSRDGSFTFTLEVVDALRNTRSRTFSLMVTDTLSIATPSQLPGGTADSSYTQTLAATGGFPAYEWDLISGTSLPEGLSLGRSTGVISGTPGATGNFSFVIRVTDTDGNSASRSFSLNLATPLLLTTEASLPNATANNPYSEAIVAEGGTPPYTWQLGPGSTFPSGLTISSSTGMISGTPTVSGEFLFTIRARDQRNAVTSKAFRLQIAPAIKILTPAELSGATLNTSYSAQLAASGGATPNTWQLASGSTMPPGLVLSSTGAITGSPTQSGEFSFGVRVSDQNQATATRTFSLTVASGLSITTPSALSGATAGAHYDTQLAAAGGATPYTWTLQSGASLPTGLSLNASTGVISGTPTASGSSTFGVVVTDNQQNTATRSFSLTVAGALSISTPSSLPTTTLGVSYSTQLAAAGGTTPYTWQLANGSALPAGLSLGTSTGLISGTPTQSGRFSFTVQVRDAQNVSASRAFSLEVSDSLVISTPAQLPGGQVGSPYTLTLTASGGTTPYAWRIVGEGGLPTSFLLNASSGVLAGTPSQSGEYTFTVEVIDAQEVTATRTLSLVVGEQLSISSAPELVSGKVGEPYSIPFAAVGGSAPYSWDVESGTLPAGLTLASSGVLSGTPSEAGSFAFTIRVQDASGAAATKAFSLAVSSSLVMTTGSLLQSASVNAPYSAQLSATGGTPPYTWVVNEGSMLPSGLSLQAESGSIAGAPTQAGDFQFTIRVMDAQGGEASRIFRLSVVEGLTFTTVSPLTPGTTGSAVEITFQSAGGIGALTYSLAEGSALPEGLSLTAEGVLTGTPSATYDGSFTLRVTDSSEVPQSAERSFAWRVNTPVVWLTSSLPEAELNASYTQNLQAEGGFPAYMFALESGNLPTGLTLQEDGSLSGEPTVAGSFTFAVQVADQDNRVATQEFVLVVSEDDTEEAPVSATVSPTEPQPSHNTQLPIAVVLAEPGDEEISGEMTVQFTPATDPPVDDPAIQFVSGGRSVAFAVPPGETNARFGDELTSPPLQVGTVAGELTLQLTLRRNGKDVTPEPPPTATIALPAVAPTVNDLTVTRTASGLNLVIRGFATGRTMQSAVLEFTARPGANVSGQLNFTVDLASAFTTWYSQEASFEHGSRFQLTIPVTINGDTGDITGVTVRLRNQQGESSPLSATF